MQKLPGLNTSGNVQNSVFQSGEYDPEPLLPVDDSELIVEAESVLDAEGELEDVVVDQKLLKAGDMVTLTCVRLYLLDP